MTMDAIALLKLSMTQLGSVLRIEDETDDTTIFRAMGRSLEARPLDDCTTLDLAFRFDTPESTLGSVLRRDLGTLIEAHGDERGVFVYPSVAHLEATTYEAALEELGEGGMWVAIPKAEDARVGAGDALGVFQGLASGLGPDLIGQVQQMVGNMPKGDDGQPQLPAGLAEFARGFLENPEMRGMIEGMAQQVLGGDGLPDDLLGKAQEVAEKATAANPELAAQAQAMAGGSDAISELAQKLGLPTGGGEAAPEPADEHDDEVDDD